MATSLRLSVLDRLIDLAPRQPADEPSSLARSSAELKAAVRRDVEWLLNTRRIAEPAPDDLVEVGRSVYHFGLPDISSMSADAPDVALALRRHVEEMLALFEPRLFNVRVSTPEESFGARRQLHFRIEALLRMDPNPEQVQFDTVVEVASGKFQVAGERRA
jgi:type VI secretion system protein ImpF